MVEQARRRATPVRSLARLGVTGLFVGDSLCEVDSVRLVAHTAVKYSNGSGVPRPNVTLGDR